MEQILLKIADVEKLCAISKSTIYRLIEKRKFPRPITVGPKASRWRRIDIDEWYTNPDQWH